MKSNSPKLKICIVSAILPPAYGGAEVASFKYAIRLNEEKDSDVIIIGWDRTGAYKQSDIKYDFVHAVQFSENPKDAEGILIYFQQINHMWNCFRALVKPMWKLRHKYDYIHNFNSGFTFNRVSIFVAKLLGKKVITETSLVGDDDPLSLGRFPNWKDYFKPKFIRYLFYKMADRYVSKSQVITEIFERSGIPMSKVVQIPYSVDIEKFKPLAPGTKCAMRKKLNIWEEGLIILFVGGINVRKGVHLLLEAFLLIEKKFTELKLLIVGPTYKYDKKYISDLKEKIKWSGVEDRIILKEDNIGNVDEYMKSSDIFILPSKQEGFPISIVEAMSSGLAVIGSDIPEISKAQIDDGVDGHVFASGDSTKLAGVIDKVISSKNRISELGVAARKKAIANWSTTIVDESYKELYRSI